MKSPESDFENDMSQIKTFETNELDKTLKNLPSLGYNGEESLELTSFLIEIACKNDKSLALFNKFSQGLYILAPYLIDNNSFLSPNIEQLSLDLIFSSHYYIIREYLYYTYTVPNSISWRFEKNRVYIKLTEPTISRQFFITGSNDLLGSIQLLSDFTHRNEILELVKGEDEFSLSTRIKEAWSLIEHEAETKLSVYYNFLDSDNQVSLGNYNYNEFYKVYKVLLTKALFHRYYAEANDIASQIYLPITQIINDLSKETELPTEICSAIVADMSYSAKAKGNKIQSLYFSLYKLQKQNKILMMPSHFCLWEGLRSMFRIWAIQNPKNFLTNLSNKLSDNFLNYISSLFSSQGFTCIKNLQLAKFDRSLPDIDLLVISEEPTLGYVIYVCEVKNPVPPQWAKDQLKVLNKDSVSKAFEQLERIEQFLNTQEGVLFLRSQLPKQGLPYFKNEFLILCNFLVITSDNAGMFFDHERYNIVNYRTLFNILKKCDGDIAYVMWSLKNLNQILDECIKIVQIECQIGSKTVSYEAVTQSCILDFAQNTYMNNEITTQLTQNFIAQGGHPFDFLPQSLESDAT